MAPAAKNEDRKFHVDTGTVGPVPSSGGMGIFAALGVVVLLALAVGGLWWYLRSSDGTPLSRPGPSAEFDAAWRPPGLLLMSVAEIGRTALPHVFNTALGDLSPAPFQSLAGEARYMLTGHAFSPDGRYAAFVGVNLDDGAAAETQIYRADVGAPGASSATDAGVQFTLAMAGAQAVTADSLRKRAPSVSDTGAVLYMAREGGEDNGADSWSIFLAEGGATRRVTAGAQPEWVGESAFLFLKNDGVYRYDLSAGTEERVVSSGLEITSFSDLSVSARQNAFAWSNPYARTIEVYRIDRSGGVTLHATIEMPAHAIALSPTGAYLALVTTGTDRREIILYDISDPENIRTRGQAFDLSAFNHAVTTLTGWVDPTVVER